MVGHPGATTNTTTTQSINKENYGTHVLTFAIVEVQPDALARVDVQVGEPHDEGEQHQQQQQLELLPNLLHRETQHPGKGIVGGERGEGGGGGGIQYCIITRLP